jgi:ribosome-binding ATPase YchF (GTP1/OBG family)
VRLKPETKKRKLKSALDRIRETLLQAKSARIVIPQNNDEELLMEAFQLITAKPVLYVCNVDENQPGNKYVDQIRIGKG